MSVNQVAMPFACTVCRQEFAPMEGGHCGQCGQLFCRAHLLTTREPSHGRSIGRCKACVESSAVSEAELLETVARMEARLGASKVPAVVDLMSHFSILAPRFESDLANSPRDIALAKASALMLVQSVSEAQSAA
jgi:hypothetical protein